MSWPICSKIHGPITFHLFFSLFLTLEKRTKLFFININYSISSHETGVTSIMR